MCKILSPCGSFVIIQGSVSGEASQETLAGRGGNMSLDHRSGFSWGDLGRGGVSAAADGTRCRVKGGSSSYEDDKAEIM